jgi:hypothetical protein
MRPSPIHKLHLKSYPSPKLQNRSLTAGRRGYLASEPDNAKGEADFIALVFRTGWVFEVLGIMIAGMGLYKIIENVVFVGPKYSFSGEALVSGGFPDCLSESSSI